jgi:ABC-type transport system involved in multi-copper enzyme maturation permease subunit
MVSDTRAELRVQIRRPANWLLLVVAVTLTVSFAYVVPYTGYRGGTGELAPLLTDRFASSAIGGLPAFIGALALMYGVLVTGGEYAWETWKTLLVQQPSRLRVFAGKLVTIAAGALVLVAAQLLVAAASSLLVTTVEHAHVAWPAAGAIAKDLAGGWLIATMWGMAGSALAVWLRAVALPVGIGLVWMLAVQNLISGVAAPLLDWVDTLQRFLPGGAAGSLAAALGARADTPGVAALAGSTEAVVVLAAYLMVFIVIPGALLRSRDLT